MNQKQFCKLYVALVSTGMSVTQATNEAFRIASKDSPAKVKITRKTSYREVSKANNRTGPREGSVTSAILEYASSRSGHNWSLRELSGVLQISGNQLSPSLTALVRSGRIVRSSRASYQFIRF